MSFLILTNIPSWKLVQTWNVSWNWMWFKTAFGEYHILQKRSMQMKWQPWFKCGQDSLNNVTSDQIQTLPTLFYCCILFSITHLLCFFKVSSSPFSVLNTNALVKMKITFRVSPAKCIKSSRKTRTLITSMGSSLTLGLQKYIICIIFCCKKRKIVQSLVDLKLIYLNWHEIERKFIM